LIEQIWTAKRPPKPWSCAHSLPDWPRLVANGPKPTCPAGTSCCSRIGICRLREPWPKHKITHHAINEARIALPLGSTGLGFMTRTLAMAASSISASDQASQLFPQAFGQRCEPRVLVAWRQQYAAVLSNVLGRNFRKIDPDPLLGSRRPEIQLG
jgi:hypothetical protein